MPAATPPTLEQSFRTVRLIHVSMVAALFLYLGICIAVRSTHEGQIRPLLLAIFGAIAAYAIASALYFRSKYVSAAEESLRRDASDMKALARWRTGQIASFALGESVALWGVVVHFLGGSWTYVAPFFALGFLLLIICTPQRP